MKIEYKSTFLLMILVQLLIGCSKSPTIQEFVDLDPQFKQLSYINDKLGVQPQSVFDYQELTQNIYMIQNCEVAVYANKNKNIVSFDLPVSDKCPFKVKLVGFEFNSKKSTLKKIIEDALGCYSIKFSNECIGFCGNAYDPTDLNYLELSGSHACHFAQYRFVFDEDKGIEKWKDVLLKRSGKDQLLYEEINSNGQYNELAIKLWQNKIPNAFSVK